MYGAPALLRQRHHRRALHTRKYGNNFIQSIFRRVHQHVFLVFRCLYRIHTEQQFIQNLLLLLTHILVANQQSLGFHHYFYFFQAVAHQSRAGAYNIKNRISQANPRRDLYRTGNHVYFRSHPLFFEVSGKNAGIRSGNLLTLKPLRTRIFNILRQSQ